MWGIKTEKGWLEASLSPTKFFLFVSHPSFGFRTKEGAEKIAKDWLQGKIPFKVLRKGDK